VSDLSITDDLFFKRAGLDRGRVEGVVEEALHGADDGELFLEYRQSEGLVFDDGRLKSASFDTAQGFGLRAVSGETTGYSHATELSEAAIRRAAATVRTVLGDGGGALAEPPQGTNRSLYGGDNPLPGMPFERKVALPVSYTHFRAHETVLDLVCRLLLEKKKKYHRRRS